MKRMWSKKQVKEIAEQAGSKLYEHNITINDTTNSTKIYLRIYTKSKQPMQKVQEICDLYPADTYIQAAGNLNSASFFGTLAYLIIRTNGISTECYVTNKSSKEQTLLGNPIMGSASVKDVVI